MRFTSFDFETSADNPYLSAVELAIAVFDENRLVESHSWRFHPHDSSTWNRAAYNKHKISPHEVLGLPTFQEKWHEIRPYLDDSLLVAHNMHFDATVLLCHIGELALTPIQATAICTYRLTNASLEDLTNENNIPHIPHNGMSDALACGRLLLLIGSEFGSLRELLKERPASPIEEFFTGPKSYARDGVPDPSLPPSSPISFSPRGMSASVGDQAPHASVFFNSVKHSYDPELEKLFDQVRSLVKRRNKLALLSGWSIALTEVELGRRELPSLLSSVGAECSPDGSFFKRGSTKHQVGKTNTVIVGSQYAEEFVSGEKGHSVTKKLTDALRQEATLITEKQFYRKLIVWITGDKDRIPHADVQEGEDSFVSQQLRPSLASQR